MDVAHDLLHGESPKSRGTPSFCQDGDRHARGEGALPRPYARTLDFGWPKFSFPQSTTCSSLTRHPSIEEAMPNMFSIP